MTTIADNSRNAQAQTLTERDYNTIEDYKIYFDHRTKTNQPAPRQDNWNNK